MSKAKEFASVLWIHNKTLILFLAPLLLLPIPFSWRDDDYPLGGKMAYCLILMATYWVTEVMPLAVTAMMPVFLFPLMQILETDDTCKAYFNDVQFLVIGGLLIAIAVETWNVHERIALSVLQLVGAKIRWIMLGFMIVTAVLSMFISNTATTAMMTPIANAILDEIRKSKDQHKEIVRRESMVVTGKGTEMRPMVEKRNSVAPSNEINGQAGQENPVFVDEESAGEIDEVKKSSQLEPLSNSTEGENSSENQVPPSKETLSLDKMMLLSVCWSANLGGIGMLTGTTPNLVLKGHADNYLDNTLTFLNWSGYCIPTVLVYLVIAWSWLQIWFLGIKNFLKCDIGGEKSEAEKRIEKLLNAKYKSLGKVKFAEVMVMLLFLVLVLLWFTRDFGFAPGYGSFFEGNYTEPETGKLKINEKFVKDAVPAVLIPMLLFVIPSTIPQRSKRVDRLLDWKTAQNKMPWNVIMLLGGGFALAKGMESSKLSLWLGAQMKAAFQCVPTSALSMLIAFVVTMTTEVASNTATTQIFTPIMATMAKEIGINPYNVLLPTAVSASFAFMLPVATPPNAIAFSYGKLSITDMAFPGFFMNLVGVLVIGFGMNTWGVPIFKLHDNNWPLPALQVNITC